MGYVVFGLELGALGVEELEEIDDTFFVAEASDIGGAFGLLGFGAELEQSLLLRAIVGESVFSFFERAEDGVVVGGEGFLSVGVGTTNASSGAADVEGGPSDSGRDDGGERTGGEELTATTREKTDERGNADFRIKLRDRYALTFGGGGETALGGLDVGTAVEQFGSVTDGNGFVDGRVDTGRKVGGELTGTNASENGETILGASDGVIERRNGGVGACNTSSGAGDVLFFTDTGIAAKLGEAQGFFLIFELAVGDIETPLRAA